MGNVLRRKLPPDEEARRRRRVIAALKHGVPASVIRQAHRMDRKTIYKIAREEGLPLTCSGQRYVGVPVP